jgi:peptidoglycan/xylan/chitin deacetylase (PgdA/CDA1 family)
MSRIAGGAGVVSLLRPKGPLILMYHGIGGVDGVSADALGAHLDCLVRRRRVVTLREAIARLGRPDAPGLAAITFDDGYCDFAEHAVPQLARRGLSATLFVPAGKVGGWNDWDAGHAQPRQILDAAGLRALDTRYVEIGAHGLQHVRMAGIPQDHLVAETRDARSELEGMIGRPVDLFAYPYGQLDDFDASAQRAVADSGFVAACSTHFGRGSAPAERFRLRRVGIEPHDSVRVVEGKLDGRYDWLAWKERIGHALRRRGWRTEAA